jgi:hypothetical protein
VFQKPNVCRSRCIFVTFILSRRCVAHD